MDFSEKTPFPKDPFVRTRNKENYQRNSEKNFFGTVTGYESPNNSRRAFFSVSVILFYRPKFSVICYYRFNSRIRIITDLIPKKGITGQLNYYRFNSRYRSK